MQSKVRASNLWLNGILMAAKRLVLVAGEKRPHPAELPLGDPLQRVGEGGYTAARETKIRAKLSLLANWSDLTNA